MVGIAIVRWLSGHRSFISPRGLGSISKHQYSPFLSFLFFYSKHKKADLIVADD
jgi:hypothetical protein